MSHRVVNRPMEILLIEDSACHARLVLGALTGSNFRHRSVLVRDGEEALEFLFQRGRFAKAPRPDLVLLDLRLPKVDGLEVLTKLRQAPHLQAVPTVVMTASEDDCDHARCAELQVAGYIHKPLNVEKFLTLLKELKRFWHEELVLPMLS